MKIPDTSRLAALLSESQERGRTMDSLRPGFEALRNRHENGLAPRAVASFNLFQTPPELALRMVELAEIHPGHRVLEPSAGLGRLFVPIIAKTDFVTAVDVSRDCIRELERLCARDRQFACKANLVVGDFLGMNLGSFDRVVMNPPFKMRDDIRHTMHALRHVAKGGSLVGLCMDTHHREKALRAISCHWEQIPAGTFKSEGTGVGTVLFKITV